MKSNLFQARMINWNEEEENALGEEKPKSIQSQSGGRNLFRSVGKAEFKSFSSLATAIIRSRSKRKSKKQWMEEKKYFRMNLDNYCRVLQSIMTTKLNFSSKST